MNGPLIAVLILLISWLPVTGPSQLVAYTVPLMLIGIAAVTGHIRLSKFDMLFFALVSVVAFFLASMHDDTGLINPTLGLLTYSSMGILAIRFRTDTERLIKMLIHTVAWLSIIECGVGILQLLFKHNTFVFSISSSGDALLGTLGGAHSHLYAIKMLFQGLFLIWMWQHARQYKIRGLKSRLTIIGAASAFLGGVFASFISGTALFAVGVFGYWVFRRIRTPRKTSMVAIRNMVIGATITIFLIGLFWYTQPNNARMLVGQSRKLATQGVKGDLRFQKINAFNTSISEVLLDNPINGSIGIGLGRYSSRAAMILSGGYLRNHPSWIRVSRSKETTDHIYSLWNPFLWKRYGGSVMGMPTSSAQSILIEFGVLGTLAYLWYCFTIARRARLRLMQSDELQRSLQGGLLRLTPVLLCCLLAVSFTDVWLEYASAMIFVYLLIAVAMSHSKQPETTDHPTTPALEPTPTTGRLIPA